MKSRKSEKRALEACLRVRLPRNYPWKVLHRLLGDIGYCLNDQDRATVFGIVRNRDVEAVLNLGEAWSPQSIGASGLSLFEFRAKYQIAALLKKYQFPTSSALRRNAAKEKFLAAEEDCKGFNTHLDNFHFLVGSDAKLLRVITYAKQFLVRLLGQTVPNQSDMSHWMRHGPGANLDTVRFRTDMYHKYQNWPYSCTSSALGYARFAIESDERWLGALEDSYRERFSIPKHLILDYRVFWSTVLNPIDHNRITFVPKNARTERSIAIEPAMNLFLQLGVDGYIRRRLKRWGVDLDDQCKNQELARIGSEGGLDAYCTIDLAAASDTISTGVCKLLLPPMWYHYLMDLRSPKGLLDGNLIEYQKISSMGNGYTFALESLLFTSIVFGVEKTIHGSFDRDKVAVYGDDIIVRRSCFDLVVKALAVCGFRTNLDKTFYEGPFRESCGADWLNGQPVRPVFLTKQPKIVPEIWCDANRLQRQLELFWMVNESTTCQLLDSWVPAIYKRFQGPFDNEDFDSYRHVPHPIHRMHHDLWTFPRLTLKYETEKCAHEFHIRKLMATLLPRGQTRWGVLLTDHLPTSNTSGFGKRRRVKISTGGNVFTVPRPYAVTVCVKSAQTSIWPGTYSRLV